jgi:hypothetical protein
MYLHWPQSANAALAFLKGKGCVRKLFFSEKQGLRHGVLQISGFCFWHSLRTCKQVSRGKVSKPTMPLFSKGAEAAAWDKTLAFQVYSSKFFIKEPIFSIQK